jgi:poly-gamma-glutamate system protein
MHNISDMRFILLFTCAMTCVVLSRTIFLETGEMRNAGKIRDAIRLAEEWMKLVQQEKEAHHHLSVEAHHLPSEALLGDDFSEMTTTLGSLDAKKISVNPQFAGLVVRWITELGLDSTDEVMVSSSGSFPGLALSVLAALQTMNQRAVLTTSVGASSYGANQPAMTIIDMETLLNTLGNMRYHPELITYGCDNDNGGGFYEGGKEDVDSAALRNGLTIWTPATLKASIAKRIEIAKTHRVRLLINIGGNHAMMGNCAHASSWPNGLHRTVQTCTHEDRGAIAQIHERGIPVIHFLNINDLGLKNGITDSHTANDDLTATRKTKPFAAGVFLFFLVASILPYHYFTTRSGRK